LKDTLRELLKGYIEKAQKKLAVADKLLQSGDYDDAVSRAYYAAFHAAQALLLSEGEKAETHKGVVTLFGLFFVKTEKFSKKFGKFLANLKDDRESGDYEVFSYIDRESAEVALSEAREFVRESEAYLKSRGLRD